MAALAFTTKAIIRPRVLRHIDEVRSEFEQSSQQRVTTKGSGFFSEQQRTKSDDRSVHRNVAESSKLLGYEPAYAQFSPLTSDNGNDKPELKVNMQRIEEFTVRFNSEETPFATQEST